MNSPTEQQLGAAFRDLVAEQPFTPDVSAIEHRARQARRRDRIARGGIGAGVVAVAAVAAVGVASAVPSAPAGTAQAAVRTRRPVSGAPGEYRRVGLVDRIGRCPAATGDAGRRSGRRAAADRQRHAGGTRDGHTGPGEHQRLGPVRRRRPVLLLADRGRPAGPGQGEQQPGRGHVRTGGRRSDLRGDRRPGHRRAEDGLGLRHDPGPRLALGAGQEHVGRRAADRQLRLGGLRGRAGRGFRQPPGAGRRAAPGVRAARHHRHPWHR